MGRSLALNKAGQHVSVWHSRIHAAIEKWEQDEAQRELLRKMASDLEFPPQTGLVPLGPDPQSQLCEFAPSSPAPRSCAGSVRANLGSQENLPGSYPDQTRGNS